MQLGGPNWCHLESVLGSQIASFGGPGGRRENASKKGWKKGGTRREANGSYPPPRGEIWEVKGGGQQEEGKDLRRLVDPKGSADLDL